MTGVVLGAGGALGQLLRRVWPGEPPRWHSRATPGFDTVFDIIEQPNALCAALREATSVLCLAGAKPSSAHPLERNTDLAIAVLDAAREAGAGRVLLASSAAVYGNRTGLLRERDRLTPVGRYGAAKAAMEAAALDHPHPCTALRIGNVAGADAILGGWRPGFVLDRFCDGRTPRRSYVGPRALARVLSALMTADRLPDRINVALPGAMAMGDLLDAAHLSWSARPAGPDAIPDVELDTSVLAGLTAVAEEDPSPAAVVADWLSCRAPA